MQYSIRCTSSSLLVFLVASLGGCGGHSGTLPSTSDSNRFPAGTRFRTVEEYVIRYGADADAILKSSAGVWRDNKGLHVYNLDSRREKIYPAGSTLSVETVQSAQFPGESLPHFVSGTCTAIEAPESSFALQRFPNIFRPMTTGGGSGSNTGAMTSSNAECEGGGAELGFSFTVPDSWPPSTTVSICVTGLACQLFYNMGPGAHNVSIWDPGASTGYGASLGFHFGSDNDNGAGSASMPGCSST